MKVFIGLAFLIWRAKPGLLLQSPRRSSRPHPAIQNQLKTIDSLNDISFTIFISRRLILRDVVAEKALLLSEKSKI